jgi:serine/threonine-protein kinase
MPMPAGIAPVATPGSSLQELPTLPAAELPASGEAATQIAMDPTLPDAIEGYQRSYLLGTGGMATVYVGTRGEERVAIKVTRRQVDDTRALERALREAKAAAKVHHPNVLGLKSVGLLPDGRPYLITELLEGSPLDVLLAKHLQLPWPSVVAVLDDVAAALEATHAQGVVHRDLKPGNVFIARGPEDVRARLLDFGLALLGQPGQAAPQTSMKQVPGTAEYSSPEQARGEALDAASDLYTLGVLAFELASGKLPFEADSSTGVLRMHANVSAPPLKRAAPDVPAALARLVDALLAKHVAERPQSATEVRERLSQVQVRDDADAPELLGEHLRSWRERRRVVVRPSVLERLLSKFRS